MSRVYWHWIVTNQDHVIQPSAASISDNDLTVAVSVYFTPPFSDINKMCNSLSKIWIIKFEKKEETMWHCCRFCTLVLLSMHWFAEGSLAISLKCLMITSLLNNQFRNQNDYSNLKQNIRTNWVIGWFSQFILVFWGFFQW